MAGSGEGAGMPLELVWWKAALLDRLRALRRRGWLSAVAVVVPLSAMLAVLVTMGTCLCIWRSGPGYQPGLLFPAISELGVDPPQKRLYQLGFAIGGGLLSLGILLFELLAAPHFQAALARPPRVGGIQTGSAVTVTGLRSAPHLNGKVGKVLRPAEPAVGEEEARWLVELGPKEVRAIGKEHLAEAAEETVEDQLRTMLSWGQASALGVVLQGVLTLERDISLRCVLHWGGAMLFIGGALQHANASNDLYKLAREHCVRAAAGGTGGTGSAGGGLSQLLAHGGVGFAMWLRCIILDYSGLILFGAPLLAQVLPRLTGAGASPQAGQEAGQEAPADMTMMNMMGLMQWGIILQFAVFFCTFTLDLRAAAALEKEDK